MLSNVKTGVEDLESSSESDLKTADRATENVLLSSDGEVDSEGSPPVVLKSIAALSKANPNSSRPTSPRITLPAPQDQVADDSITGKLSWRRMNFAYSPCRIGVGRRQEYLTYVRPIILYFATQYTSTVSGNPTSEADSETETDSGDDSLLLGENTLFRLDWSKGYITVTFPVRKPLRNLSASCSSSATESDTDEDLCGALDVCEP